MCGLRLATNKINSSKKKNTDDDYDHDDDLKYKKFDSRLYDITCIYFSKEREKKYKETFYIATNDSRKN